MTTENIVKRFNFYAEEVTSSDEAAAILTLAEVLCSVSEEKEEEAEE